MYPGCDQKRQPVLRMLSMTLFFTYALSLSAQSGLGAAGGHAGHAGYTLNYSVGQVFNTAIEQSGIYISQGIQHPSLVVIDGTGSGKSGEVDRMFVVFPNPVNDEIHVHLMTPDPKEFHIELFSMNGKILMRKKFESDRLSLPFNDALPGIYLLSIRSGKTVMQNFMIIKPQ